MPSTWETSEPNAIDWKTKAGPGTLFGSSSSARWMFVCLSDVSCGSGYLRTLLVGAVNAAALCSQIYRSALSRSEIGKRSVLPRRDLK